MASLGARNILLFLLGALTLASAPHADALTLANLRNQNLDALFGSYAPRGDCTREPRIAVDASGFAFTVGGRTMRTARIEYALSYAGPQYEGISSWFFPFVKNDNDFGPVLMTFNANEKPGALLIEYDRTGGGTNALYAALATGSPYMRCGKAPAAATRPAPAAAAMPARSALPAEWSTLGQQGDGFDPFGKGAIADAIRALLGPKTAVLRANLDVRSPLQRERGVFFLSGNAAHKGGTDMAYILLDPAQKALEVGLWEAGKLTVYRSPARRIAMPAGIARMRDENPPENAIAAPGPAWQLRPIAGRPPLALAVAAASPHIKTLSLFCDNGRPLLAMLLHKPPKAQPLTLGWAFPGGLVNVPMARGNGEGTLWLADLRASQLPRMLQSQKDVAYLRLNDDMEGEVTIAGAGPASRSALGACYRF